MNAVRERDINVKNAVLVTIDRMLFAYAVLRNVPVIYDHGLKMVCFVPNETPKFTGGINKKQNKHVITKTVNTLPKYYDGGAITRSMQDFISSGDIETIFEEPLVFFNIFPFILKYADPKIFGSRSNYMNTQFGAFNSLLTESANYNMITVRKNTLDNQDNNILIFDIPLSSSKKTYIHNMDNTYNYIHLKYSENGPETFYVKIKVNDEIEFKFEKLGGLITEQTTKKVI
jgi:hypothetical protein